MDLVSNPSWVCVAQENQGGVCMGCGIQDLCRNLNNFQLPNSFCVQWAQVLANANYFCLSTDFINLSLQMEEEPFNPDYVEVDRVLEVSLCEDKDTGEVNMS